MEGSRTYQNRNSLALLYLRSCVHYESIKLSDMHFIHRSTIEGQAQKLCERANHNGIIHHSLYQMDHAP
ncbi:unnamed protein product [Linum tenue]|uniref:Uncharacterized protein n=1 Tax=Linum tenue TaxID=586396 RepID=A0AAV0LLA8_9ROSI|nr:unnamed protein product [Linum tenue]CAI0453778.1 unnamed protein product [Linum tenue]